MQSIYPVIRNLGTNMCHAACRQSLPQRERRESATKSTPKATAQRKRRVCTAQAWRKHSASTAKAQQKHSSASTSEAPRTRRERPERTPRKVRESGSKRSSRERFALRPTCVVRLGHVPCVEQVACCVFVFFFSPIMSGFCSKVKVVRADGLLWCFKCFSAKYFPAYNYAGRGLNRVPPLPFPLISSPSLPTLPAR